MRSLPDYLAPGLQLLLVGINPSLASAKSGHYFANPRNRFWRAFNLAEMTPEPLGPDTDHQVLEFGIGFTDLVKRPTAGASELSTTEMRRGAALLHRKLRRWRPLIVCFQGLTGYRTYLRHAGAAGASPALGLQPRSGGETGLVEPRYFVVPNPSPANAAFSLEELADWFRRLKELRDELARGG